MRTRRLLLALLVVLGLVAAACSDSDDDDSASDDDARTAEPAGPPIEFVPLDPGAVTFEALDSGDVDMALLFSTQGVIAEKGWVVLEDDKTLQGSDNVVPLVRKDTVDSKAQRALDEVSKSLTTEGLTELNRRVDSDHEDTAVVAKDYLEQNGVLDHIGSNGSGSITVGSAAFSEAEIVAQMYKLALEAAGYTVTLKAQLGSREVLVPALISGDIDVEPEYVQSLLAFLDPDAEPVKASQGVRLIADKLDPALDILQASEAQDQNAVVVTAETARKYDLEKVSDLLAVEDQLKMAGPPECPKRPLCIPGYADVYGLKFDV
jgi:osmoprotectant transport system substrate-binding protein